MKIVPCVCASESGFVNISSNQEIPDSLVDMIIAYEAGELTPDNTVALFQALIDTHLVWKIHGSYEHLAKQLIAEGLCSIKAA